MAGILDWLGGTPTPGGILGAAAPATPGGQSPVSRLGLIGATLKDVGANLGGQPGQATALDTLSQQQQEYARQQAQMQAAGQIPQLLQAAQSGDKGALSAALGNPYLAQMFGPGLVTNAINQQQKASAPYTLGPGMSRFVGDQQIANVPVTPNPNHPFNPDGTPNKAYQDYQKSLINARAASGTSDVAGWQILNDPDTNTPFRYNVRTGQATTLQGQPYQPNGASHIRSGQVRSAQTAAVQKYMQEHPDATANDIAQFSADFGATGKSVGAFSTGKQGDLIRSFNVGISHLNTLGGLVDALGNGDVQALNKLGNSYAQQTGNPAPTNFDAAKAIVGDEIIKAIVGGGGALADRENAQNQINRANSPQQLRGVIQTYKELMAGQLGGLKKQYSDTTHRDNFDNRLSPEAKTELERNTGQQTKTIGGQTYVNVNGKWYHQ